jgi:hypothetical protein
MQRVRRRWLQRTPAPWRLTVLAVALCTGLGWRAYSQSGDPAQSRAATGKPRESRHDILWVTSTRDDGSGSLRDAIERANAREGADTIRFDARTGPFRQPQTIAIAQPLPELTGELTIDGYIDGVLWEASGVTLSGADTHRVLSIAAGARVTLRSLTIARGHASQGGGIVNLGTLVVYGASLVDNRADVAGGGLANLGGSVTIINSTFAGNRAGDRGGGVAGDQGALTVTNSSFSGNAARLGGGLASRGALLLRNSILANSAAGADCVAEGFLDPASTHNLIEVNEGCGTPISSADPRFGSLGAYNGPTPTLPLQGGSPAINLGDNTAAVDESGIPLAWDQRGNGDPRCVAGFTDLGAFEVQAFPVLKVNTAEDTELRACSGGAAAGDCPLRGAIAIANAMRKPAVITFDPKVFATSKVLAPRRPLPDVAVDLTLDAGATSVVLQGEFAALRTTPGASLTLRNVMVLERSD